MNEYHWYFGWLTGLMLGSMVGLLGWQFVAAFAIIIYPATLIANKVVCGNWFTYPWTEENKGE